MQQFPTATPLRYPPLVHPLGRVMAHPLRRTPLAGLWYTPSAGLWRHREGEWARHIEPQEASAQTNSCRLAPLGGQISLRGVVDSQAASSRDQDKRQPRTSRVYQVDAKYLPSIANLGLPMSTKHCQAFAKHCQPRTSYVYQALLSIAKHLPSIAKYPRLGCYSMVLGWRLSWSLGNWTDLILCQISSA